MSGVEIKVQMHENKLAPFLESLPAKLAYHVFKVISEIYIHKATNGGRPPAGYNDEAWPPLSRFTIYRKLLAEQRRRRAERWRTNRAMYKRKELAADAMEQLKNRMRYWRKVKNQIAGTKDDIRAQARQAKYGAPPPALPAGQFFDRMADLATRGELLPFLGHKIRSRREIPRLVGVKIRPVWRASLAPMFRKLWRRAYHSAYDMLLRSGKDRSESARRAAGRAWRAVISKARRLTKHPFPNSPDDPNDPEYIKEVMRTLMRHAVGRSFYDRYQLYKNQYLDSSMVLMMIDSGAIYNSLLPGTVGRDDRTGSTVYIINRRSGRGGSAEDRRHERPGQICSITVHGSTTESPLRAEVTIGVRVVDRVEVGKGANRTVVEVPYALYHHYGPAVEQESGRRRPRPKRRLWPADLARLLEVSLRRLLRSSRLTPIEAGDDSAPEGDGDPNT